MSVRAFVAWCSQCCITPRVCSLPLPTDAAFTGGLRRAWVCPFTAPVQRNGGEELSSVGAEAMTNVVLEQWVLWLPDVDSEAALRSKLLDAVWDDMA